MTPPALLTLRNVEVAVQGQIILRDIYWQVLPGQHWGIVGGNGSGKSTLLKLAAGMLWPAPGRGTRCYDFGDGPMCDAVEARRRITWVGDELQDLYFRRDWNFRALDVVLTGLYRTDIPRRRPTRHDIAHAQELLARTGLLHLASRPFLQLSRGEQRRVLIARALAFRPALLLLDEPAAGLDATSRSVLDGMLQGVAAHTVLICAEHHRHDLPAMTTHTLTLANGRIVAAEAARPASSGRGRPALSNATIAATGATMLATAGTAMVAAESSASGEVQATPGADFPTALISLRNASVWIGTRRLLADLNWQLNPGCHWLVLGNNGAGKSTFLRLLHGQLRPALGGHISWPALGNPRNIWHLRERVAWVSPQLQADYRYPTTVRSCIASGFTSSIGQTRPPDDLQAQRIDELLASFELLPYADRLLTALSYGQVRRALICRAIARRPDILLLDEPWEGLDADVAGLVQARLDDLVAEGAHLVCASHWSRFAAQFMSRYTHSLELEGGRVRT